MMLCDFHLFLKFVCSRPLELMSDQRGSERAQVFVRLQPTEALGRLQHAAGRLEKIDARSAPTKGGIRRSGFKARKRAISVQSLLRAPIVRLAYRLAV
jgi:hypothetical protein